MSEAAKKRPQFRNIHITDLAFSYRMPLAAKVSIMHRVSGAFIFLLLPFILYLLDNSLTSEGTFEYFRGLMSYTSVKLVVLALAWAYLHHFCAGMRHLVMDLHIGATKEGARSSAIAVLAVSLPLTALFGLKLFGVF
ncbi:MAG TPA: succinate dehydrogenase, cytochrome b556 subunit [Paucimonas sp.]|nr:succinate dehydrogenase, cytochrome b556 subunit [Paucimonas sp.]